MKIIFYLLLSLPLLLSSQVFKVGDYSYGYQDIIDTTMSYQMPISNRTYSIDVNNDGTSDFGIQAYHCCGGMGGHTEYINVKALNFKSYIRFGRVDSVYHNNLSYWLITDVAERLSYNDTINSVNAVWQDSALSLTNNTGSSGSFADIQDWISSSDNYIGLKYQTATDTSYGWLRVNCPNASNCTIKDMGFSGIFQSVNELHMEKIIVYPNPSSSSLQFNSNTLIFNEARIEVINALGEIVLKSTLQREITISSIPPGIYTILFYRQNERFFQAKLVKE